MGKDWKRVLSDTTEWNGRVYAEYLCNTLNNSFKNIDGFFLTLGPGMVGTEAWVFNEKCPNLRIMGYEPQVDRFNFLKDKFPGELSNLAVTAHHGEINGWMGHQAGKSDFWLNATGENTKHYVKSIVSSTTIDKILEDETKQGVLWMDIEGSELEALRGAVISLMMKRFLAINVEINFIAGDEKHCKWYDVVEMLRCFGYIACASSSPAKYVKFSNGFTVLEEVTTDGHCDIIFSIPVIDDLKKIPAGYLKPNLTK